MRAWIRVGLLVGVAALATGCWDRVEVNDLAIVTGVALDADGPETVKLTVAIAVPANVTPPGSPGAGGGQEPANTTKAAVGRTVMEAVTRLQEKTSRRLFWAHNGIILIGDELARRGVGGVLDFFSRHRQPRLRAHVVVAPQRAEDLLATWAPVEADVPSAMRELGMQRTGLMTDLLRFTEMLLTDGREPVVARMEAVAAGARQPRTLGMDGGGGAGSGGGGSGSGGGIGSGGGGATDFLQPAITGTAIFKGDRLVGYLDDHDTRGLLWLLDELVTGGVTVTLGEPGRWITFELLSASSRVKPRFENGRIVAEVTLSAAADIVDNAAGVDAGKPAALALLEEELAETIAVAVRRVFRRLQEEFGSDAVGIGDAIRRHDPQRWNELAARWDDVFPTVELDVHVRARVRGTGLATPPLARPRQDVLSVDDLERLLRGK